MAPVVYVDLLNLACCALEAARGFEQWCSRVQADGSFEVVSPSILKDANRAADVDQLAISRQPELSILVVAGTVTHEQGELVRQRFEALPEPRAAVAFGVCTISGGPYWDSYSVMPGIEALVPVDIMVPGCPPLPEDVEAALDELVVRELADSRQVDSHQVELHWAGTGA